VTRRDGKQPTRKVVNEAPRRPKRGDAIPDGADLEAKIKGQLQSIAAALAGLSERPPAAAPPPPAPPAETATSPFAPAVTRPPQPLTPTRYRRSEFAPDPVRQRTYVDLRSPPEQRQEGNAPARPASIANRPAASSGTGGRWPPSSRQAWDNEPVASASPVPMRRGRRVPEDQARSRGLDARTLSIASLLGIGMGLAGLAVMNQFGSPTVPSIVATSSTEIKHPADGKLSRDRIVTAAQRDPAGAAVVTSEPVKEQARLVTDAAPALREGLQTEAMVAEDMPAGAPPGTAPAGPTPENPTAGAPAEPTVAESTAGMAPDRPVVAEASPEVMAPASPPREDAAAVASDPHILAYAPVPPTRDPTSHSFRKEAASDSGPAQNKGSGTARVNADVNMHSGPDNGAPVVAVVPTGTLVRIARCDYWCEVTVDGKRGFIYRKFVGR